jgi:flagellar hook-length control protein FliK
MVKGTTPVPSLESPQGAKANATFTQMDGTIRWLLKNQEKGAEIQLNPESLGRVVIKLRVEGSEVHARLWASEASTVPLLQDQRAALEASLRQQGLNLGSFNLQQGRRGDDAQQAAQSQGTVSGPGIAEPLQGKQDLPSLSPAALGGAHLIEILA